MSTTIHYHQPTLYLTTMPELPSVKAFLSDSVLTRVDQLERKLDFLYLQNSEIIAILSRSGFGFNLTSAFPSPDPFLEPIANQLEELAAPVRSSRQEREERKLNRSKVFQSEPCPESPAG